MFPDKFVEDARIEIVDFHSPLYFCEGICSHLAGSLRTLAEHLVDIRDILFEFLPSRPDRLERVVEDGGEEVLHHHVSESALAVLRLDLVEAVEFEADLLSHEAGAELVKVFRLAECIEVGEDRVAFHFARIADLKVVRVCEHAPDFGVDLFSGI